jgi:acyl carrier protein
VVQKEQIVSRSRDNAMTDEVLPLVLDTARGILGQHVQPSDNFFDLGGDSTGAVELMYTLEVHFGVEFDPATIVAAADMAGLAISLNNQL